MQKYKSTNDLRKLFTDYFEKLDHKIVSSSSLIPVNDPTLLFTNAGMVQFKEAFLGIEVPPSLRIASVQRCMRAGGKHNDLENVGYTSRHHTFFEMLGNFSFGDYFKREAIEYAWKFLTDVLKLTEDRLWVTVFRNDSESENIWLNEIKISPERFSRCGEKDNFWQMGDTGPCGPCTEIFYDHGPNVSGGPPGSVDADGDRYVEIWNLVFMQYNRDLSGKLHLLSKPCVDTGMGLERIAAVMQGVHDNYEIDLFQYLLKSLSELIDKKYDFKNTSMRVIVDHIRSVVFLICDGVLPSNEGRGYVLRRIIRRATRHGYKLGQHQPFFYKLIAPLIEVMGEAYPLISKSRTLVEQVIQQEEVQFSRTLAKGLKILDYEIEKLSSLRIPGEVIFHLYDTFGFPPDLTADIARERGLSMDYAGFDKAMEHQRKRSQQAQHFAVDHTEKVHINSKTEFVGYDTLEAEAVIVALLQNDKPVSVLEEGKRGVVVLDRTPFYAESGGQVGDCGYLINGDNHFYVKDTRKQGSVYFHIGEVIKGKLNIKEKIQAKVDNSLRIDIMRNHSATHLLHEALRRVLGEHVMQKGSLVEAKRLRFDFSHPTAMTKEEVKAVEKLVNEQIQANWVSNVKVTTPEEAREQGALALFDERYGEIVRVLQIGSFSVEICGGTHVKQTGEIGLFKIISESACAAGVRRIEAVTGRIALSHVEAEEEQLQIISNILKTDKSQILKKLNQLLENHQRNEKQLIQLKQQIANQKATELEKRMVDIQGVKVLATELDGVSTDINTLRSLVEQLKKKFEKSAIILAIVEGERIQLVAGVTKKCLDYFDAPSLLAPVAERVGGNSGGRSEVAQGGGNFPEYLKEALKRVPGWVEERIKILQS